MIVVLANLFDYGVVLLTTCAFAVLLNDKSVGDYDPLARNE